MKFFIVILAVIGIDNYVGQATAYTVTATVDSMLDTGSNVLRGMHTYTGNNVQFLKTVKQGDLTYSMKLTMDGAPVNTSQQDTSHDFCEDTPPAQILRGALLPARKTSCPARKGNYNTENVYDVEISDSEGTKMECGDYTALADIMSDSNIILQVQFTFDLDQSQNNCT